MVTIGVDAHKAVHQALALDAVGTVLGSWRGATTPHQWQQLRAWAAPFPGPRPWGGHPPGEGAWKYGRGLAQFLVTHGEHVYEVNPRCAAQGRRRARTPGKHDRLDAHAVAQLVRDEGTPLPRVAAEDQTAVRDLVVIERETALGEATLLRNQIHQLLLQLDPD